MADTSQPKVLEAVSSMGQLLPHVAGVAVSLTAVAYYAGWRDASSYFNVIGAPWAFEMLPAASFLYLSAELVTTVLLFAFFSVHAVAIGIVGLKGQTRVSFGTVFISVFLIFSAQWLPHEWFSAKAIWKISTGGGMLFAAGAGLILGELVVRLSESELRWTATHAYLVYAALFIGVYTAPAQVGIARARFHLDAPSSALPNVNLPNKSPGMSWFLVSILNDKVLVMGKATTTDTPQFRLVSATEVTSIDSMPR